MARELVPLLDLREDVDPAVESAVQAEMALLGAVLCGNNALDSIEFDLEPSHFVDGTFGRIFERVREDRRDGAETELIALDAAMRRDAGYKEMGGRNFLVNLIEHAPPAYEVPAYAATIAEFAAKRQIIALGAELQRLARGVANDHDAPTKAADILAEAESRLFDLQRTDPKLTPVDIAAAADDAIAVLEDDSKPHGVHCGFGPLHALIGPMLPKELHFIGARSSMGKSALGCSIAERVAAPAWWRELEMHFDADSFATGEAKLHALGVGDPAAVLYVSAEMTIGQVTHRMLTDIGHALFRSDFPTFKAIRDRTVTQEQRGLIRKVRDILATWPIQILKKAALRPSQLRAIIRRWKAKLRKAGIRPGLVIVDHLGLMKADARTRGRYEQQADIVIDLQQVADDVDLPLLVLAQCTRESARSDDKRPQLEHLRDAGQIEECADSAVLLFREAYYAGREQEPEDHSSEWADWDKRIRSKRLELIPGKVRAGSTARSEYLWIDVAWNAVRSSEPPERGGIL